ncbi:hypothetical protein ZWY2020_000495 [Hordeum vulgare]|nr:hypothetical protein ZWY2020_000495 [Hordeum vulgare]
MPQLHPSFLRRHYAYGCYYWDWVIIRREKLLVLDIWRMEFSIADLPPGDWSAKGVGIVEAGEDRLWFFGFEGEFTSHLSYYIARNKGESPIQWQMEKTISLDSGYKHSIDVATERHLLLTREATSTTDSLLVDEYFSMDTKTLQLQRVCLQRLLHIYGTHIYTDFPPSLFSSPAI